MALHSIWQEYDGQRTRWNWQLLRVKPDGSETVVKSGIADSENEARKQVGLKPKSNKDDDK